MVLSLTSCFTGMEDDDQINVEIDANLLAIRQCRERIEHRRRQYDFSRLSNFSCLEHIDATLTIISHRLGLTEAPSSSQSSDTPPIMVVPLRNSTDEHFDDSKFAISFSDSVSMTPLPYGSITELPTLSAASLKATTPVIPSLLHMPIAPIIDYLSPNDVHSPPPHQLVLHDTELKVKQDDSLFQLWPMASLLSDWATFIYDIKAHFQQPNIDRAGNCLLNSCIPYCLPMGSLCYGMFSSALSTSEPPPPHPFSCPVSQVSIVAPFSVSSWHVEDLLLVVFDFVPFDPHNWFGQVIYRDLTSHLCFKYVPYQCNHIQIRRDFDLGVVILDCSNHGLVFGL